MTADEIIRTLGLRPHPEGGYFTESFRDTADRDGRPVSTAIYYLLKQDQVSHWHRVDAAEGWHWYAGAPLALSISVDGRTCDAHTLGPDLSAGERPQTVVPAHAWQSARSLGAYTLVGCTVAPGFEFAGFEMASDGWAPGTDGRGPA
jgi:predicted cupin superfamily sugar epimerase